MSSLISDSDKLEYSSVFGDIHDTFSREVVVFKQDERVDIVTNDEFLAAYSFDDQSAVTYSSAPVSGIFKMRIKWLDAKDEDAKFLDSDNPSSVVRLKMTREACHFIMPSQSIYVDGEDCEVIGSPKMHGLFAIDYYTVYAKKRNII
jgi:hypothetical protein